MSEGSIPHGLHNFIFVEPVEDEEAAHRLAAELRSLTRKQANLVLHFEDGALYALELGHLDDHHRRRLMGVARSGNRTVEVFPPSIHWLHIDFDDEHSLKVRFLSSEKLTVDCYLIQRLLRHLWREGETIDAGARSSVVSVDSPRKAEFLLQAAFDVGADISLAVPQTVVHSSENLVQLLTTARWPSVADLVLDLATDPSTAYACAFSNDSSRGWTPDLRLDSFVGDDGLPDFAHPDVHPSDIYPWQCLEAENLRAFAGSSGAYDVPMGRATPLTDKRVVLQLGDVDDNWLADRDKIVSLRRQFSTIIGRAPGRS